MDEVVDTEASEAETVEPSPPAGRVRRFLAWSQPAHGPLMLLGGVLWDFLTLRIDRLFDNLFLGVYLLLFALVTVLKLRVHLKTGTPAWLDQRIHWVHNIGQFLLGGLLSAYLIFYIRGAPLLRAGLWLLILGLAAAVNELLPRWLKLPELWVPLLTVLGFHYVLAAGPVMTGWFIGPVVPTLVAVCLAIGVHALATLPWKVEVDARRVNRLLTGSSLGVGVALVLELFAFRADLVPPLPLTLMGSEVVPEQHETYEAGFFGQSFARLGIAPTLTWTPGLRVKVKTPVYLPASMSTTVRHVWERYEDGWIETDSIPLRITGGRKEGYRTYSRKRQLQPGSWRVRVTTDDGRELGRVRFDLEAS